MRQAVTTIEKSTVAQLRADGAQLFEAAWAETKGEGRLQVDWEQYQSLEDCGRLIAWGVWVDDKMVGYSAVGVLPALNTRDEFGELLSIFVHPEYRREGLGKRMIRLTEQAAEESGAKLRWRTKRGQALDLVLPKMGYEEVDEVIYVKKEPR